MARSRGGSRDPDSALDVGTAHHTFLQFVALERTDAPALLRQEASRLQQQGLLTADQVRLLDFEALAAFWQAEPGRAVLAHRECVHRELPFTFRLSPETLADFTGLTQGPVQAEAARPPSNPSDEFIVVQGVADLVVLLPDEIWLLDFKTDKLSGPQELPAGQYAPQLKLYAKALNLIYSRPVTQCWLWFLTVRRRVQIEL